MTKKLTKDERREAIVKHGLQLARKVGAEGVSLAAIAAKQGVSTPLLFHIMGTKTALVKAIKAAAKAAGVTLPDADPVAVARVKALSQSAMRVRSIKEVKAIKNKVAAKKPTPVKAVKAPPLPVVASAPAGRKPLTEAQRTAKAERDRARRAAPVPGAVKTPPFKSLPPPFEASIKAVGA